jgi:hypothetical protein
MGMSRTLRRAQERQARKAALKANRQSPAPVDPAFESEEAELAHHHAQYRRDLAEEAAEKAAAEEKAAAAAAEKAARQSPPPPSPRRTAANRRNAQLSTGPRSDNGKSKISLNALKTGLTGHTVLLPGDDHEIYQWYVQRFMRQYTPVGSRENELVQSLADHRWRLERIPGLEKNIYALARIEFQNLYPEYGSVIREGLIEAKTFLAYQKQLNNLNIQEARLRRHFEKDLAELRQLQAERREAQEAESAASQSPEHIELTLAQRTPAPIGFEFSPPPQTPHPIPESSDWILPNPEESEPLRDAA